jgi:plasmid stabilization system protein ParE
MREFTIDYHRLAAKELEAARRWYVSRSLVAAADFEVALNRAVRSIETRANSLGILVGKYRSIRVQGFPYIIVFRPKSSTSVKVVAVAHTSRRPGYWLRRK